MFQLIKQPLIKICIIAAIVFGAIYVKDVFFDFILSLVYYIKFNAPSIAYLILRIITILCPLILLTPLSKKIKRVSKFRVIFFITGVCYLFGNTWIVYFLAKEPASALFDINQLVAVQRGDALVLNYLVWNCFTLWSVLFSTVQGILYLFLSKKIMGHRKPALLLWGIILLISFCLPILYSLLDSTANYIDWMRKDIYILLSQLFVYIALLLAGTDRYDWSEFLWHH